MKLPARISVASLISLTLVASLPACARVSSSNSGTGSGYTTPSCSQLQSAAVNYARSGTGDIDSTLQALADNCSDEYEVAVDYVSHARDSEFRIESCDELLGYGVRSEAVALLEEDGWCTSGGSELTATAPEWPEGGLGWDSAAAHAGAVRRVCGPLISARETTDGTFLNVGRDYPSADRFTGP